MGSGGATVRPAPGRVARSPATTVRRPVSGSTRISGTGPEASTAPDAARLVRRALAAPGGAVGLERATSIPFARRPRQARRWLRRDETTVTRRGTGYSAGASGPRRRSVPGLRRAARALAGGARGRAAPCPGRPGALRAVRYGGH